MDHASDALILREPWLASTFPERPLQSLIGLETLVVAGVNADGLIPLEFKPSAWRLPLQCANLSCLTVASTRGGACGLIRCDARQSYDG